MPEIKRRHFLQLATSTLASLGLNQFEIQHQSLRYAKVLAQSTPRKLALLVGINKYSHYTPLNGCLTDLDLQRELLINRFNFNPQDILTLSDEQATRKGILTAFEEHLIKQAKPGDVVVFHFSGHGSQIADPDKDQPSKLNSTFIPIDTSLVTTDNQSTVSDIMGHTLFLLMSAVKTDNLTVVLDSCHSGGGKRGNIIVRAANRPKPQEILPSAEELAYQQQWLSNLKMSPETFKQKRLAGIAKGIVIASVNSNQLAADAPFQGFSAGLFTYLMTQYLWQQAGSIPVVSAISQISRRTAFEKQNNQTPELECNPSCELNSNTDKRLFYFLPPTNPAAEAVITQANGKTFTCWLGGIDTDNASFENSIFSIIDSQEREQAKVKITSRDGLSAQGTFLEGNAAAIKAGALLQEQIRGIPNNLALRIGLDPSLESASTEAATLLKSVARIEAITLQTGNAVEYILGKMTATEQQKLQGKGSPLPEVGSFGLFNPSKEQIIEGSFGSAQESIAAATRRLQPKFKVLLAGKVLKATVNANSSKLSVEAAIVPLGGRSGEVFATTATSRGRKSGDRGVETVIPPEISSNLAVVKPDSNLQIQLKNNEQNDLYINVLAIDSEGEITVLFPSDFTSATEASRVAAGQTLQVPQPNRDNFQFTVGKTAGVFEILIIASVTDLKNALKGLKTIASATGQTRGNPLPLADPSEVITGLLSDFDNSTRAGIKITTNNTRLIDNRKLAAFSIVLKVS